MPSLLRTAMITFFDTDFCYGGECCVHVCVSMSNLSGGSCRVNALEFDLIKNYIAKNLREI